MGLDMYLNRRYYVKNWEHTPQEKRYSIKIERGDKPSFIPTDKIKYIETEEIYWRKASAIHKWFVDNIQDGEDNCESHYVSVDNLRDLLAVVTKVLESPQSVAGELLPTQDGCFFGGTDYDQHYIGVIEYTRRELERILASPDIEEGEFEYCSRW